MAPLFQSEATELHYHNSPRNIEDQYHAQAEPRRFSTRIRNKDNKEPGGTQDDQDKTKPSDYASEEVGGVSIVTLHNDRMAADEQPVQSQFDSDTDLSELTELSDFSEAGVDIDINIDGPNMYHTESQAVMTPHHIHQGEYPGGVVDNTKADENSDQMLELSDSDTRSIKRMKMNNGNKKSAALAPIEDQMRKTPTCKYASTLAKSESESISAHFTTATKTHLATSPSTPPQDKPGAIRISLRPVSKADLPLPLSSNLLSPVDQSTRYQGQAQTPPAKPSLKMSIIPKGEYDALKSHNSILRSHNLSLARRNNVLTREKDDALASLEEMKDTVHLDHNSCVRKDDYQELLDENQTLRIDMTRLRYEHQLMKECGMEWARRENIWDIERPLLRKEVTDLMNKVNFLVAREQEFAGKVRELESRAQAAEQNAQMRTQEVLDSQVHIRRLHAIVNSLDAQNAGSGAHRGNVSGSVYPPL